MKEKKVPFQLKTVEDETENTKETITQEPENKTATTQTSEQQKSSMQKKVEEYLEQILLGNKKPIEGVKIHIKIQGSFSLLGTETTKDSIFEYKYPNTTTEEDEPAPPETPPPQPETEEKPLFKR